MNIRHLTLLWILLCLNSLPVFAETEEELYRFERMWPVLQQPWYFDGATDIVVDSQGHVYIPDTYNNGLIKKLTQNGHLIRQWQFDDEEGVVPHRIAVDSRDNIYVLYRKRLSSSHSFMRILNSQGELINEWGDNGEQSIGNSDLAIDGKDNVYITSRKKRVIQKFVSEQLIEEWLVAPLEEELVPSEDNLRMAIDHRDEFMYVLDQGNHRILKYDMQNGEMVAQWGKQGQNEPGEFYFPEGIAINSHDNIYVTDSKNNRVQILMPNGKFTIMENEVGSNAAKRNELIKGSALSEIVKLFNNPNMEMVVSLIGLPLKIKDVILNSPFFILPLVEKEIFLPEGIAVGPQDEVYVTYTFPTNSLKKYTFTESDSNIISWSSSDGEKQLNKPFDIAKDKQGNIYITDTVKHRVVKTTANGIFVSSWGKLGQAEGEFIFPIGIAIDSNDNVYVVDAGNFRIQKFSSEGEFLKTWGGFDEDLLELIIKFNNDSLSIVELISLSDQIDRLTNDEGCPNNHCLFVPSSITIDNDDNIFVVDNLKCRINKFNAEGEFIQVFGKRGDNVGEFSIPMGMTVDKNNHLYVVDLEQHNVKKFTTEGQFIKQWGEEGNGEGQFKNPYDVTTDNEGNVYVSDAENERIQKFSHDGEFLKQFGELGTFPDQFNQPGGLIVDDNGKVYVTDLNNNRVQVFNRTLYDPGKAIIVAGGGPYAGNDLWDDTQMVANFVYRALAYQGFTKNTIYYLSAATGLDLDNNGEADDVDAEPTEANLEHAITEWASDVDNLTIFLTNHGGDKVFTLQGEVDILNADKLNGWLSTRQNKTQGKIKIIYDACYSGSFVQTLKGENRIIITSAAANERAYFDDKGSLSFSNYFWTHVFYGLDIETSFNQAASAVNYLHHVETVQKQTPWLEANADGCVNTGADFQQVKDVFIGNGTYIHKDAPEIKAVSPAQTLTDTNSAIIYAEIDNDNIARVWAVVRSPLDIQRHVQSSDKGAIGQPILKLPSFELKHIEGTNRYEGSNKESLEKLDFDIEGRYEVAIYARDRDNNTSVPKTTSVFVENPLKRKAIIIAGELPENAQSNTKDAYETLKYQGYRDENIYYISESSIPGMGVQPVKATLDNVEFSLTTWLKDNTQDIVIYMEGLGNEAELILNEAETLPFDDLKVWLDALQPGIPGAVAVIYEGPSSGYLLPALAHAPSDKTRIVITSTGTTEIDEFNENTFTFSKFFWQKVYNGTNTRNAFRYAKSAIILINEQQAPQLDANGNGKGNENDDKKIAREHSIGIGVVSASELSVDNIPKVVSCLIPSQMEYHQGDKVQVEPLPILPTTDYKHYFGISSPDGRLFTLERLNDVIPFESVETLPIWENTDEMVIDITLDANIPAGGYRLYSITLPKETALELPLDPKTVCDTCLWVEE